MARRLDTTSDRPFRTAEALTYTVQIGDDGRAVKVPPGPEEEQWMKLGTEIDETGEPVDWTRWARFCRDWWGSTSLAGAGQVTAKMVQIKAPRGKSNAERARTKRYRKRWGLIPATVEVAPDLLDDLEALNLLKGRQREDKTAIGKALGEWIAAARVILNRRQQP
jgi:hypothetical protein